MIEVRLAHVDGSVHTEQCRNLEIAYAVIGEYVVRGWKFVYLKTGG